MSVVLPLVLDTWRMVAAGRCFEGVLPLEGFPRLKGSLTDTQGECQFHLEFGRDAFNLGYVEIRVQACLPLLCQRSLERYLHPVSVVQRLGLITDEDQEAILPADMEPLLLEGNAEIRPMDLIEDELILALPVVPINPDSAALSVQWPGDVVEDEKKPNPFAALAALKGHKK